MCVQLFAWEAYKHGQNVHFNAQPTQLEFLYREHQKKKEVRDPLMLLLLLQLHLLLQLGCLLLAALCCISALPVVYFAILLLSLVASLLERAIGFISLMVIHLYVSTDVSFCRI